MFKKHGFLIEVEGLIICVLHHLVIDKPKTADALGIQQGGVERIEEILLNDNAAQLSAVEGLRLTRDGWYFGINRNHCIGELEEVGQRVDKLVLAND